MSVNITTSASDIFDLSQGSKNVVRNSSGNLYAVLWNDTDNIITVFHIMSIKIKFNILHLRK